MVKHRIIWAIALFVGVVPAVVFASKEEDVAKNLKTLQTAKDGKAKVAAASELGRLGSLDRTLTKDAAGPLIKACKDSDAKLRAAAAEALGRIDPYEREDALKVLIELVKDDKEDAVKRAAARGLGTIGPDAKTALPALREALKAAGKKDGTAYKAAIGTINPKKE